MSAHSSSSKDVAKILRQLQRLPGWRLVLSSNHVKCFAPDGKTVVGVSLRPGSPGAVTNFRQRLRKAGVHIDS